MFVVVYIPLEIMNLCFLVSQTLKKGVETLIKVP